MPLRALRTRLIQAASFSLFLALLLAGVSLPAHALTTVATPFTGDSAQVRVDFAQDGDDVLVTLTVEANPNIGDLRGFFLDIADDALLTGLSVTGADVTQVQIDANAVINLGGGNNLNGGGTPCPCDIGVEIGDPGIGMGDDIQSTTLLLSHVSEALNVSLFNGEQLGVRLTSVGLLMGPRSGSSKLAATVPEPSTALLLGLGFAGIARHRRR